MLLSDLRLDNLPIEVLKSLQLAIKVEIKNRRTVSPIGKQLQYLKQIKYRDHKYKDIIEEVNKINSELMLSLPIKVRKGTFYERLRYLPSLLNQDWTALFPVCDTSTCIYYVYAHVDQRHNKCVLEPLSIVLPGHPFYIGKGSGHRAWDLKRNQGHGKRIKSIRDSGYTDNSIVTIIAKNLDERDALCLEAKLIYFFGSMYDESINGCLLNLADHIKPVFAEDMRKLPTQRQCAPPN